MKITQEMFDGFRVDENGYKICPSGDYSDIKKFGERCSFGKHCSFGKRCSFGEGCSFGKWCSFGECCSFGAGCKIERDKEFKTFLKIEGIGSEKRCTYFYLLTDNTIYVRCGCHASTIDDFVEKVKSEHQGTQYELEYLDAVKYVKSVFARQMLEDNQND